MLLILFSVAITITIAGIVWTRRHRHHRPTAATGWTAQALGIALTGVGIAAATPSKTIAFLAVTLTGALAGLLLSTARRARTDN